jgi:hypothetical protein
MELLTKDEQVVARIMRVMAEKNLGPGRLGHRLGWNTDYTMLRLGLLLPLETTQRLGGRYPLRPHEVAEIAAVLDVDAGQLLGAVAEPELALAS